MSGRRKHSAIRLVYDVTAQGVGPGVEEVLKQYLEDDRSSIHVVIGDRISIEHTRRGVRAAIDPESRRWLLWDQQGRAAARGSVPDSNEHRRAAPIAIRSTRKVSLGKEAYSALATDWSDALGRHTSATWIEVPGLRRPATRVFTALLDITDAPEGVLLARLDVHAADGSVVSLVLKELTPITEPPAPDWDDPLDGELEEIGRTGIGALSDRWERQANALRTLGAWRRDAALREALDAGRKHQLRSGGQAFAWVTDQSYLDLMKDVVNSVTRRWHSFYGDGDGGDAPMHVRFDWWPPVADALSAAHPRFAENLLAGLLFTAKVVGGQDLPPDTDLPEGLDLGERRRWDILRRTEDALGRVTQFHRFVFTPTGPASRRGVRARAMAMHEFDKLTSAQEFIVKDGGTPLREIREEEGLWVFKAWDFDTTFFVGGNALLDRLTFEGDAIRLGVTIPAIHVDCQWNLTPNDDEAHGILTAVTAGIWALVNTHYGHASVSLRNLHLEFDLIPRSTRERIEFEPHLVRDATSVDTSVHVFDANPAGWTLSFVGNGLLLWFQEAINESILDTLAERLEGEGASGPFWPDLWRAVHAPESVRGFVDPLAPADGSTGAALWEGHAYRVGGVARDVDRDATTHTAVALSPEYLAGWLRSRIGSPPYVQNLPADELLAATGVELPDPASIEDPEPPNLDPPSIPEVRFVDCGDPPSPPGSTSEYVLELRRRGPTVELDPPGETDNAGLYKYSYELILRTLRTYYRPVPVLERDCVSPGDEPGAFFGTDFPGWSSAAPFASPRFERLWLAGSGFDRTLRRGLDERRALRPPGGPEGGGGWPEPPDFPSEPPDLGRGSPGRACAYSCSWDFEPIRVSLGEFITAEVEVTGRLMLDFDPMDVDGDDLGIVFAPLRLSIARDVDFAPAFETSVRRLTVGGPFESRGSQVQEYLLGVARPDAAALLAPAVVDERIPIPGGDVLTLPYPAVERHLVPTIFVGAAGGFLDVGDLQATADLLAGLIVRRQRSPDDRPVYRVSRGMLYWPITVSEAITDHLP